jgi:hypothetical protein
MSELSKTPNGADGDAEEQPESADGPASVQPEIQPEGAKPPWKKIALWAGGVLLAVAGAIAVAHRSGATEDDNTDLLEDEDDDEDDEDDEDDDDDYWGSSSCSTCDGIYGMQYCPECHRVDLDA